MAKANINMNSMKLELRDSDPTGTEGQVIYNSTEKKIKFYNGTSWGTL